MLAFASWILNMDYKFPWLLLFTDKYPAFSI